MNGKRKKSIESSGPATIADLYRTEGKAELIDGRIVDLGFLGWLPSEISGNIAFNLDRFAESKPGAIVGMATLGYVIPILPSGRQSFCPDASYYDGPHPDNPMHFVPGPPKFAVEIRKSERDSDQDENKRVAKRADYFQAGSLVVWDVDPLEEMIFMYTQDDPEVPTVFLQGDAAHAEPAVPGWRMRMEDIFEEQ